MGGMECGYDGICGHTHAIVKQAIMPKSQNPQPRAIWPFLCGMLRKAGKERGHCGEYGHTYQVTWQDKLAKRVSFYQKRAIKGHILADFGVLIGIC